MVFASSSVFNTFFQSDWFGKLIFLSLFTLSIVSWVIMISKARLTKNIKSNCNLFEKYFEKKKGDLLNFDVNSCEKTFNPYFSIYSSVRQKTLEILDKNKYFSEPADAQDIYLSRSDVELVEAQVGALISHESKRLEKNLFILSTIITLAPFLGLLGTVWGILLTFSGLQTDGMTSANSAVLAGLAMALGTTVFGLVVAIPPLIGYNYLKSSMRHFFSDMELFSNNLMTILEIQYRRVDKK